MKTVRRSIEPCMKKNLGEYVVSVGFIVFALVLAYILFDTPEHEDDPSVSYNEDAHNNGFVVSVATNPPGTTMNNPMRPSYPMYGNTVPVALQQTNPGNMNGNDGNMTAPMTASAKTPDFVSPNIKLAEGHWQGMEVIELTPELKTKLNIPMHIEGLLVDEVTLIAMKSGLMAGDILIGIGQNIVKTIEDTVQISKLHRNKKNVLLTVLRNYNQQSFVMTSPDFLGFVMAETAPMILPSDIMPHPYRGECTSCHPIGHTGHITPDPDGIPMPVPPIPRGAIMPHRERGPCQACHTIF